MLSQEKNERLTAVGPGTPMGNLLRRYWWPVATHDMAGRVPVRRRLLGEDLVLFRDAGGRLGLLAEHCLAPGATRSVWDTMSYLKVRATFWTLEPNQP